VEAIVKAPNCPPMDDLLQLGVDTGFRLLWIRDQRAGKNMADFLPLTLSSLKCNKCYSPMFNTARTCAGPTCTRRLSPHEFGDIFLDNEAQIRTKYPPEGAPIKGPLFVIGLGRLSCGGKNTHCPIAAQAHRCPTCSSTVREDDFLLGPDATTFNSGQVAVNDIFKDELAQLRSMEE
jgi:hypothetical protein